MLSSNVRELTFSVGKDFSFVPGQWVNLYFPELRSERRTALKRAYSIASGPRQDGSIDLAITRVTDGPASTGLHAAKAGQSYEISGPHGVFVLAPLLRPVLMIATGTGVAPFRSMLEAVAGSLRQPVTLLFGVRNESDILYRDEFETLAQREHEFTFLPTLSRPSSTWLGRHGYVQMHIKEILEELGGTNCDIYVCGLAKMVADVREVLVEHLGVERKQIHIERYD